MGTSSLVLICGILFVLVIVMLDLAISARGMKAALDRIIELISQFKENIFVSSNFFTEGGFCVWIYREGRWELSGDYAQPGYEPGPPPSVQAPYEGYALRKAAVRRMSL